MEFFRRSIGYTEFDHKLNELLEELKVQPVDKKLRRYKSNWLQHVTRMNKNRIPKIRLNHTSNKDNLEDLLKTLLDEARTGLLRSNL
jgi:hypothetical protein